MQPRIDRLARRGVLAPAARLVQVLPVLPLRVQVRVDDAGRVVGCAQNGGARGIGEEDARAAIGEVGDAGERFGPDAEHGAVLPGLDVLGADREAIDRARARGLHVDRAGAARAKLVLDEVGRRGKRHVGARRADDDKVDVLGHEVRALERLLRGAHREVGCHLALFGDVPLADAGALHDPLVRRVDQLFEVGVGQDVLRRVRADTDDLGPLHSRPPSRPSRAASASSAALMCSFRSAVAHSRATRTAFLMAFTGEAPWQTMAAPLIPSNGAPPISV